MSSALVLSMKRALAAKPKRSKQARVSKRTKSVSHRFSTLSSHPAASRFLRAYTNTLNDPFEYSGVNLGYDCFLPTTLCSGYLRNSVSVNADGSFAICVMPDAVNFVQVNNGLKTVAHSAPFTGASNISAIQSQILEARVVSCGLRCFALFPETSAPGVFFSGTVPDFARASFLGVTTDGLVALPSSHIGIGTSGSSVTLRPYDNASFEFFSPPTIGFSVAVIPFMTSGYICGVGFPAGTTIWYEAVINLEGIAVSGVQSSVTPSDDMAVPTGASFFPTAGALFTAAQQYLSPPVVMDGLDAAAGIIAGDGRRAASAMGRIASRSVFGRGSNIPTSFVHQRSREATVMIEEMKEDSTPPSGWKIVRH